MKPKELRVIGENTLITTEMIRLINQEFTQKLYRYFPNYLQDIERARLTVSTSKGIGYALTLDMWFPEIGHTQTEVIKDSFYYAILDLWKRIERMAKQYPQI
ncbi:MAG: hypothetical protein ACOX6V_01750 [Patescibacteria group bacterium]|jgi:hypothetical protein